MMGSVLQDSFNFNAVALNTLALVRAVLGDKTFFIGHTSEEGFTVLKSWNLTQCVIEEGIFLPLRDSY